MNAHENRRRSRSGRAVVVGIFAAMVLGAGVLPGSDAEAKPTVHADVSFGEDPSTQGEWIADVERPAEGFRGRYQLRLREARAG